MPSSSSPAPQIDPADGDANNGGAARRFRRKAKRAGCGPKPKLYSGPRKVHLLLCRRRVVATDSRRVEPCLSCEKHRILLSSKMSRRERTQKGWEGWWRAQTTRGTGTRTRRPLRAANNKLGLVHGCRRGRRIGPREILFVSVIPTTRSHKHVGRTLSHFDVPSKRFFTLSPSYVFWELHNQGQWMMKSDDVDVTVTIQQ
jgi:hypothetical protein